MRICVLGIGNVGTSLVLSLHRSPHELVQLYNRTFENIPDSIIDLNIPIINDLQLLTQEADVYVLCVKDDVLPQMVADMPDSDKLIVHTAGSVDIQVLEKKFKRAAVMYPFQTFSKSKPLDFDTIPLCLETSYLDDYEFLEQIATSISKQVYYLSGFQRKQLHIAAVFACNFVNHFYGIAYNILQNNDLPFELMHPLILETAQKALLKPPHEVQTGPAVRGDEATMQIHKTILKEDKELVDLYSMISDRIFKTRQ